MNPLELLGHRRASALRCLFAGGSGFPLYLLLASLRRVMTAVSPPLAALLATLVAILPTFHLQRVVTFQSSGPYARELLHYALLHLINAVVIAFAAKAGTQWLQLPDLPAFFAAGVAISGLAQAWLVFRHAYAPDRAS